MLVAPLPPLELSYIRVVDVPARLEVRALPQGEGLVSHQPVHALDRPEQENLRCLESLGCPDPCIIDVIACLLISFLDEPLTLPDNHLLPLIFPDLLPIPLKSIPEPSPLNRFRSLPQPILQACDHPCVLRPRSEPPPEHVPVDYVAEALDLEALLAEPAPGEAVLLGVAPLQAVLQLLVLVHQVLGHPEQPHHPLPVGALPPPAEGHREVSPVKLDEPQLHPLHGPGPVGEVLLPDLKGAVFGVGDTHAPLSQLVIFVLGPVLLDEGVALSLEFLPDGYLFPESLPSRLILLEDVTVPDGVPTLLD